MRKRLFPCDTAKFAVMDETDDEYIVSNNNGEIHIPKSSPIAELEAWNAYIGALDAAVNKRLRERPQIQSYIAELLKKVTEETLEDEIPIVQMPSMR